MLLALVQKAARISVMVELVAVAQEEILAVE